MDQRFFTGDKLIGLSALFVSLLTLMVFIYQTNLIRKQQFMAVYPHLNLINNNSWSLNYKYVLENEGVGPAFIRSIEARELNGTTYEGLNQLVDAKLNEEDSVWVHYSDIYPGKLISAGEEIILFGLSDEAYTNSVGLPPNTLEGADKLRRIFNSDRLEIEIVYESIYGERWSVFNHSLSPEKH